MGNKALKVLVFIGCFSFQGIAQSIPIQLMVVDSDGFEKVNHAVKLRLTLTNDTSNTTGQYQEVHLTQSNDFGIVSESLGGGVVTTNSSVYALSEFAFNATEPMIKIELDTTALSNQYYTVGTLAYTYPLVSRRALRSDSADYSSLSLDAEYADTAEFARNFDESYDGDTSYSNELQSLYITNNGYLKLSESNDSVLTLNYDTLTSDLLKDTLFTSSIISGSSYSLECVDMGVSSACGSLGISSGITLKPSSGYTYDLSPNHSASSTLISNVVNWRKFKIIGLDTNNLVDIRFKYKRRHWNSSYDYVAQVAMETVAPLIVNDDVYFYIYYYPSRQDKSCGTGNGGSCVYAGRTITVPAANTWYIWWDCWNSSGTTLNSYSKDIEILFNDGNSLKHTGIIFGL